MTFIKSPYLHQQRICIVICVVAMLTGTTSLPASATAPAMDDLGGQSTQTDASGVQARAEMTPEEFDAIVDDVAHTDNKDADALNGVLSKIHGSDAYARGLRDRILLVQGYRALEALDLGQARKAFDAVSEPGAQTSAALLGLGWSYIYPEVPDLKARLAARKVVARRLGLFDAWNTVASGRKAELIQRALVPWQELIGRNPLDPAVQEAMIAIPYALDHLGAFDNALQYRVTAVETLGRVDLALKQSLDDGSIDRIVAAAAGSDTPQPWFAGLPSSKWWLHDHIDPPSAFYWRDTLNDPAVVRALLSTRKMNGAESRAQLHDALSEAIRQLDQTTEAYLAEARLALAREYEPPTEAAR